MSYRLAVDLGTTFTAAAVAENGVPTLLGLGNRAMQIPSVHFIESDGTVLVGETAERRGASDPNRLVRESKRRIGDPVKIIVGGMQFTAETLAAELLRWVVARATQRMGRPPDHLVVTHPANLGTTQAGSDGGDAGLLGTPEPRTDARAHGCGRAVRVACLYGGW